ncbi:MAG: YheU family protein [Deltaproteobacteria bacterium]|nr:YheU family protein [Deltaproteobacteria bacterium]
MQIPIDLLEQDTLRNVIENFITREGTDYGDHEVSLEAKINQVMRQLRSGTVILVFDAETESVNIVPKP